MSLNHLAMMCSHLQNASKAKLGLTSVAHSKANLNILLAMHKAGYISFVTRGSASLPPDPLRVSEYKPEPLTSANVARQRLWVGLKYNLDNSPVMGTCKAISTPTRFVTAKLPELERIARGIPSRYMAGLNLGESVIIRTDRGVMECREAVKRKVGGGVLCRIGP